MGDDLASSPLPDFGHAADVIDMAMGRDHGSKGFGVQSQRGDIFQDGGHGLSGTGVDQNQVPQVQKVYAAIFRGGQLWRPDEVYSSHHFPKMIHPCELSFLTVSVNGSKDWQGFDDLSVQEETMPVGVMSLGWYFLSSNVRDRGHYVKSLSDKAVKPEMGAGWSA
jgi:hypothetical protein